MHDELYNVFKKVTELNRHTTRMEIRRSVVSLSFILPHPPEDKKKNVLREVPLRLVLTPPRGTRHEGDNETVGTARRAVVTMGN